MMLHGPANVKKKKKETKFVAVYATETYRGSIGIAPLILNLGT